MPYLVSVADPYDRISKHHRWGTVRLTPAQVGKQLGSRNVRDLIVSRGPSGRVTEVKLKVGSGTRTLLSQDFRRALELRSTWFTVRVLNLEQPAARSLAAARRPVVLKGFVRGLGKVRLEQQVSGGSWKPVRRIRLRRRRHRQVPLTPS